MLYIIQDDSSTDEVVQDNQTFPWLTNSSLRSSVALLSS